MKKIVCFIFSILLSNVYAQNTVTDYDGIIYHTVTIGSQIWMKENLRSVHYTDGTLIPNSCWYNNITLDTIYGKLYQWDAAMKSSHVEGTQGACPVGWHLPSNAEWIGLFNSVSDSNSCAFALKDTNTLYWTEPLISSNTTNFSIVGSGNAYNCFSFDLMGTHGEFWTSTEINEDEAKNWSTNNQSQSMFRHYNQDKLNNFSIRCIKNNSVGLQNQENLLASDFAIYYSNPILTIDITNNIEREIIYKIISIDGEEICSEKFTGKTNINLTQFSNGVYIIILLSGDSYYHKKIIR